MKASFVAAIVLIVVGILALAYGGFTFTRHTSTARIGSMEISMKDRETVNVPIWAGVASIVVGGGILLVPLMGRAGVLPKSLS